MKHETTAAVTLWANRVIAVVIVSLLFVLPALLDWYCTVRFLSATEQTAISVAFYCCAVVALAALWRLDCLLRSILAQQVFISANVNHLRFVRWCCLAVSLICLPAAFIYYPLIFMVVIMGFLFLVVNVICQVMKAAVALREENDLTI
ncbi:MAG: DUF2975 domain-containing protein [Oscillospiraceae bacterium]|nr:DUF2975 domain-containing protein [Oscillospiraceae bacterium]